MRISECSEKGALHKKEPALKVFQLRKSNWFVEVVTLKKR